MITRLKVTKYSLLAAALTLFVAGCGDDQYSRSTRHLSPIPPATMSLMSEKGMTKSDPILVRSYKKESEMEIWKKRSDGQYALLKTYPICRWSGQLGPKNKEGDRQAPEGFYTVTPSMMNPNSSYYLSFDTGYPNALDRSLGRSGSNLMVHGSCSSRGCFAMTDESIAEIYAIAREAMAGGQKGFQFQSYPFHMNAQNLAKHRHDPNMAFWRNLKEGADYFDVARKEPKVAYCGRKYVFNADDASRLEPDAPCSGKVADPELAQNIAKKQERDNQDIAELVAKGTPAIKLVYDDGGQHRTFGAVASHGTSAENESLAVVSLHTKRNLGEVSRPEALASGPREVLLEMNGKPVEVAKNATKPELPKVATAYASSQAPVTQSVMNVIPPEKPVSVAVSEPSTTASTDAKPFYKKVGGWLGL